jgi:hypothetical protein
MHLRCRPSLPDPQSQNPAGSRKNRWIFWGAERNYATPAVFPGDQPNLT